MSEGTSEAGTASTAIDIDGLLALLPHRYPFLLIDRLLEVVPGVSALAIKCVSVNEPYFQGHFPGRPILPGVLIAEAFAQVAAVIALSANPSAVGQPMYLLGVDKLRLRKPVRPGDVLRLRVSKLHERQGVWDLTCEAEVEGVHVASARLLATIGPPLIEREP